MAIRAALLLDNREHSIDYMIVGDNYHYEIPPKIDRLNALSSTAFGEKEIKMGR